MADNIVRCGWTSTEKLLFDYHDNEWGRPLYDDRKLFENFVLDGFQAGLSWLTILKKREAFRIAFDNFEITKVASFQEEKINELLLNPGIIRNRQKIVAAISNAKKVLEIQKEFKSFSNYIWSFSNGKVINNNWPLLKDVPATSSLSDEMSRDMKKRGFAFAGSTICYAFLQAVGVVNDHIQTCSFKNTGL